MVIGTSWDVGFGGGTSASTVGDDAEFAGTWDVPYQARPRDGRGATGEVGSCEGEEREERDSDDFETHGGQRIRGGFGVEGLEREFGGLKNDCGQ